MDTKSDLCVSSRTDDLPDSVIAPDSLFILVFKDKVIWLNIYILDASYILFTTFIIRIIRLIALRHNLLLFLGNIDYQVLVFSL
jgi:hypothetical protein